jgi:hypothetical protein
MLLVRQTYDWNAHKKQFSERVGIAVNVLTAQGRIEPLRQWTGTDRQ